MAFRKPLIRSHERGVHTDFIVDPDGTMRWETRQDAGPILEANKRYQSHREMRGHKDGNVHIAEIPNVLYNLWVDVLGDPRKGDPDVEKRWKARLNDMENRHLRIDTRKL